MHKVAVLMPVYNGARYLRPAIESILSQTYTSFRFMIINDGSTDETASILERYTSDPRVQVVHQSNKGLPSTLNRGLQTIDADLVARMDADDIAEPSRLERQVSFLAEHSETVLVGTDCWIMDAAGEDLWQANYETSHQGLLRQLRRGSPFPHASAMFRRKAALDVGGYNPRFLRSEDLDLWLRLSEVGKLGNVPSPLLHIRKHESNMSKERPGLSPAVFAMAGVVCYLKRINNKNDPSTTDESAWNEFLRLVHAVMVKSGTFNAMSARERLREHVKLWARGKQPSVWHISKALIAQPPLVIGGFVPQLWRRAANQLV